MNAPRFMKEYAAYAKKKIMAQDGDANRKEEICDIIDKYIAGYEKGAVVDFEVMNEITHWVWLCY